VQTGWTTVRPWRPPRDDADEPILDDDEKQPDWDANPTRTDAQRGSRSLTDGLGGQPRRSSRVRPPAWPGGGQRQGPRPQARRPDGGNQSGAGQNRPRPGGNSAGGGPPAGGGQRRRGTWMRPGAPRPDDE